MKTWRDVFETMTETDFESQSIYEIYDYISMTGQMDQPTKYAIKAFKALSSRGFSVAALIKLAEE